MIHWWRMNQVSSSLEKSIFFIHSYKFPDWTVTLFNNSVWNQEGKTKINSICLAGRLTGITLGSVRNNNCTAYRVEKFNLTPVFFSVRQIWKLPSIKSDKDEYNQMSTCDLKCILHSFNQKFKSNILPCAHISYSSDSQECKKCNI